MEASHCPFNAERQARKLWIPFLSLSAWLGKGTNPGLPTARRSILLPRGAESQRWARSQLKYYASLVLCSPKQPGKMAEFSPDFHVTSKKKGLRSSTNSFVSVLSMGPIKPIGPSDGPLQAHGPLQGARPPPPMELSSMIKMSQKAYCFFSFNFYLVSSRTTYVINNNIDDQGARV